MDVKEARKVLGKSAKGKTDKEIQIMLDQLKPLVGLAVEQAKKKFSL